jgi:hypothetical protein
MIIRLKYLFLSDLIIDEMSQLFMKVVHTDGSTSIQRTTIQRVEIQRNKNSAHLKRVRAKSYSFRKTNNFQEK